MIIDIRTLLLLICISTFIQAFTLYVQFKLNKKYKGLLYWAMSSFIAAMGYSLYIIRDVIPYEFLVIILPNVLLILTGLLLYIGIMRFFNNKENLKITISIFVIFILFYLYYTYMNNDISSRSVVASFTISVNYLLITYSLIKNKILAIKLTVNFLIGVMLANSCFYFIRGVFILLFSHVNSFYDPTFFQVGAFMIYLITGFLYTFGLIIMVNQRLNAEISEANENLEVIFNTSPDAVLVTRMMDGYIVSINEGFTAISGFTSEESIGKSSQEVNIWNDINDRQKVVAELKQKGFCENFEAIFKRKNGSQLIGLMSSKIILLQEIPHIISVTRDITESKSLEAALLNEKKLLETTIKSVGDGVISTDNKGKIVFLNRVAEKLTGWEQEEARGVSIEEVFKIANEFTRMTSENITEKVLKSGKTCELANHTILISRSGREIPIEDSAAPIIQENGEIYGVVLVFRDFTEKKLKQEEIEFLSYHDQLTGLYNRRFFEEELKRLDTIRNLPITIIMGDVEGLKLINDSFGHAIGDELLKKVAELIKKGCRSDDIIARLGGDEFIIILPKTDLFEAEQIVNRINSLTLNEKIKSIDISITFGFETKKSDSENMKEIVKRTEDYMYRYKLSASLSMRNKTLNLVIKTLFEKSSREMFHSKRVSEICEAIAIGLGLQVDIVNDLKTAGLMHDIGKIGVNEHILNKPDKLNNDECKEIERHPEIGYRILSSVNEFSEIANYVLEHHERWDGKGYPRGLKGEEISLQARILTISEAYDAMTVEWTYKKALSEELAINEIRHCSGTYFDPDISKIFVEKVLGKEWK